LSRRRRREPRVSKEGRRVCASDGALQHHFQNLPAKIVATLPVDARSPSRPEEERGGDAASTTVSYSLANVLRINRPLVIVDEAHNARTALSFDTLARFRPAAILEFTATPDAGEKSKTSEGRTVSGCRAQGGRPLEQ
jgi:type III restriction enzyme